MTLIENVAKFSKFVKSHPTELSPQVVQDVARAIVLADTRHLTDSDRGKYEHLTLSGLAAGKVPEFKGVSRGGEPEDAVSILMQMRIMCDVLTIVMGGDYPLAMRYSSDVARVVKGERRPYSKGYLSFEECEEILDGHCSSGDSFDEALRPVFEQTEKYLAEMKNLQPRLDRDCVGITKSCTQKVWLPKEFNSSGFDVSVKVPRVLDGVPGDIVAIVTCYNLGFVLDALIKAIVRNGKGDMAQWAFLNRLQDISGLSQACFPVPTGVVPGIRDEVYVPYHFLNNQALRVVYERHFDKNKPISVIGVDAFIKAIKTWLHMS